PVDNGGAPVADWRGRKNLDALVADPRVGLVICPLTRALPPMSRHPARGLVEGAAPTEKPICVGWGAPVQGDPASHEFLLGSRLPLLRTFANCVRAVRAWVDYHSFRHTFVSAFSRPVTKPSAAAAPARHHLQPGRPLSEHGSKAVLAAYGIPVTADLLA